MRCFRQAIGALELDGALIAADMSPYSPAFQLADRRYLVPRCTSDEFVSFMVDLCQREGVRLLIPTIDTELPVYAANKEAFAAVGCNIAISDPATIAIGCDKLVTHAWLLESGLPTVQQATAEAFLAMSDAEHAQGGWDYPLIAKPVNGSSSIGVVVAETRDDIAAVADTKPYIVQTMAPGVEFTVSVLADRDGRGVCAVPRQRLEVRAGEVSKARAVRNAEVQELAIKVVESLPGAYGAINVQLFWDAETGAMNIIELNTRFGGGYPLAWQVGARYPQWMIEELLVLPSTAKRDAWDDGVVMLRFDDAVFVDGRGLPPR